MSTGISAGCRVAIGSTLLFLACSSSSARDQYYGTDAGTDYQVGQDVSSDVNNDVSTSDVNEVDAASDANLGTGGTGGDGDIDAAVDTAGDSSVTVDVDASGAQDTAGTDAASEETP